MEWSKKHFPKDYKLTTKAKLDYKQGILILFCMFKNIGYAYDLSSNIDQIKRENACKNKPKTAKTSSFF